ncbi:MAG: rhodanese-like domain-containing protein [Leptolyngbyaceae cyanobacterium SM1_1_3]|nr:rhodanese-like domain-containing protein [Leptolyngbyaceae cyanobacterium SM1_1_3]NJN01494.1 rhodanese-like domain-containing protein [Leptolyngbyaceae cyanobacterium RM1_1_2]NJO08692.1 rhodanese-like domain-containing protein [Leptolyngbyaceae cyanobacterium SL_1_1]
MFPKPAPIKAYSRVYDLKSRLDWGEPALTIIDVRDRQLFNQARILGAVSMPMADLVNNATASLELERDLYVYAETDEDAAEAIAHLHSAGFKNVSLLRGGVAAWKAVGFPTESTGNCAA